MPYPKREWLLLKRFWAGSAWVRVPWWHWRAFIGYRWRRCVPHWEYATDKQVALGFLTEQFDVERNETLPLR